LSARAKGDRYGIGMTKTELGTLMRRAREAAGISQERMGEMLRAS